MRSAMKYNSSEDRYPIKNLQDYSIKKHLKKNSRLEQTLTPALTLHNYVDKFNRPTSTQTDRSLNERQDVITYFED